MKWPKQEKKKATLTQVIHGWNDQPLNNWELTTFSKNIAYNNFTVFCYPRIRWVGWAAVSTWVVLLTQTVPLQGCQGDAPVLQKEWGPLWRSIASYALTVFLRADLLLCSGWSVHLHAYWGLACTRHCAGPRATAIAFPACPVASSPSGFPHTSTCHTTLPLSKCISRKYFF